MKATMTGFALAALLFVGAQADDAGKQDAKKLQGTWTIKSVETPKGAEDALNDATLTFESDGTVTMKKEDNTKKGTYKLNAAAKPREITVTTEDNKEMSGIYALEKGKLKLCFGAGPNAARPNAFAAPEGGSCVMMTLERAKK